MRANIQLVFWVDPGLKTGIAGYDMVHRRLVEVTEGDYAFIDRYLRGWGVTHGSAVAIGWESFKITAQTAKKKQAPWSLEVIGICRAAAACFRWEVLQDAAPADRFLGRKEWVDQLGWCPRGMRDDGMSACQHLLAWMLRSEKLPQTEKMVLFPGTTL